VVFAYLGYGHGTGVWDGYSPHHHLNAADGLHLSSVRTFPFNFGFL
jgi:hypothetical protein